ncbi:MAG: hypothetical protein WC455_30430, partial [Dehalococcoidia bacterium]
MQIRYVNHLDVEIDLTAAPYTVEANDILDYDWVISTEARADGRGGRVASFGRSVTYKMIPIHIRAYTNAEYVAAVDALHDAFETDVDAKIPGTLYVGDSYVMAYATASAKTGWHKDVDHLVNTITFAIESDRWNIETTFDFYDYENIGATGFRYPGKYPAKYCASGGVQVINNT